jgi:hypothetical protein
MEHAPRRHGVTRFQLRESSVSGRGFLESICVPITGLCVVGGQPLSGAIFSGCPCLSWFCTFDKPVSEDVELFAFYTYFA